MSKEDIIRDRSAEPEIRVLRETRSMHEMDELCPTSLMSASPLSIPQMRMVQSSEADANLDNGQKTKNEAIWVSFGVLGWQYQKKRMLKYGRLVDKSKESR